MTETEVIEPSGERTRVGFPDAPPEKPKSGKGLIIVIVLLLLLLGVGGWFMFGRQQLGLDVTNTATPTSTTFQTTNTPTPTEAEEEVVREGVLIQVLNGTGIAGAAGELQSELEDLGYSGIKVGNASPQNSVKTTIVFDTQVDDAVREDLLTLLEGMYQEVTESERTLSDYDVIITTGNPVGGRPATSTPTRGASTVTPTRASTTGTVSATPTKTPTPTP